MSEPATGSGGKFRSSIVKTLLLLVCLQFTHVAAQVLNMSHDLVALGIAGQNMTPNTPSLDARPLFQAALLYVQNHPVQTLTVDAGSYYLLTPEQSNAVLVLPRLSNLVVDLAGSTFYFNTPLLNNGFLLYFCSNLTFTNFQTDYIAPPYTHVTITSVDAANRVIHYQNLAGWPDPSTFNNLADPFGGTVQYWAALFRNGQVIPGTSRTALVPPFANPTLVLQQDDTPWTQTPTLATLQSGDTVVVSARAGGPPVEVWQCDSITLSNVKIYGSNGFAVQLYQTSNTVVDHVSVMPRPGVGLVGSNADGIHFSSTYQNNHIRNCYVTRTEDDALIMDSQNQATVVTVGGPRQLTVQRTAYNRFPNGTAVNFVDPVSTNEFPGATIVSQSPPDSDSPGFGEQVVLNFDRTLPALTEGQFMVYGSALLRGSGSTFEDNVVEDIISGKGIWINGVMSVIAQRNVIRRTSEGGVSVSQDTEAYPAPPAHDITVTDNALETVVGVYGEGTGVQDSLGAIQVVSTDNQSFGFATASSNSDITIQNNYVSDSGRSGIWVGELNGGTLQNNLVIRSNQNPSLGGIFGIPPPFQTQVTQDALQPVVIHYSSAVTETSDTVSATSTITAPVTMTPASAILPAIAGGSSFGLQTAVSGFGWNASSDSSWLTVTSPLPGTGSGTVQYSVTPNAGAQRVGHITIAGEVFTVTQVDTSTPTYTLTLAVLPSGAGTVAANPQGETYVGGTRVCFTATPNAGWAFSSWSGATLDSQNCLVINADTTLTANFTSCGSACYSLDQQSLYFGATNSGAVVTAPQKVQVTALAGMNWSVSSSQPYIVVSPTSGTGNGSFTVSIQSTTLPSPSTQQGTVTVTAPAASNSPQTVQVNVKVMSSASTGTPFGSFDTPANNTTGISGSIAVTGWALDNIGVQNVQIWRNPIGAEPAASNGLVYIGDATFVPGARPDVQSLYPTYPLNNRAGWGYLMLTNGLPNNGSPAGAGNGTYTLHAIATSFDGKTKELGTKTITCDNTDSNIPFGAIDTPGQGATVSGTIVNFGWALTPQPYSIPTDGSTISVTVDGVTLGHPVYNQYRSDIANGFPGFANSNGAIGYYYLDTTTLSNGLHTIGWLVYDNNGHGAGIGSRFFWVQN